MARICFGPSVIAALVLFALTACGDEKRWQELVALSRSNCVRLVLGEYWAGTGFLVDSSHIVTCAHGLYEGTNGTVTWRKSIPVVMPTGETNIAGPSMVPLSVDSAPVDFDFAVLRLESPFKAYKAGLRLSERTGTIGEEVLFTGFPLLSQAMLTHKSIISGAAIESGTNIIYVQASIYRGNSGGALMDANGYVLGILTEGALFANDAIDELMKARLDGSTADVFRRGVKAIYANLSTGVGRAFSIQHLQDYLRRHRELLPKLSDSLPRSGVNRP